MIAELTLHHRREAHPVTPESLVTREIVESQESLDSLDSKESVENKEKSVSSAWKVHAVHPDCAAKSAWLARLVATVQLVSWDPKETLALLAPPHPTISPESF